MSSPRFSIFPWSCVYAGPTTLNLRQMDDVGISPSSNKAIIYPGGSLDAGAIIENMADPMLRFSTRDLTTLFGAISPVTGLYCTGGATARFQVRAQGATFSTGGSHTTFASTLGWLLPQSLRASQDDAQGAVAQCTYTALFDGTNKPFTYAINTDLDAATTPSFISAFFLGPVYLGSSEIPGVIESNVDFGIDIRPTRSAGFVYADNASVVRRAPRVTFRTLKVSAVSDITSLFGNAFGSAIKVYYRKGVSGGARVADATTSHCMVTVSAGDWTPDDISVRDNADGTLNVTVTPTGTIAISVASAIP